jgi:hypothetical protein
MGEPIPAKNKSIVLEAFETLGAPVNWIAADIVRIQNGILVEWLRFLLSWITPCA